jgi:hypothetical protein
LSKAKRRILFHTETKVKKILSALTIRFILSSLLVTQTTSGSAAPRGVKEKGFNPLLDQTSSQHGIIAKVLMRNRETVYDSTLAKDDKSKS